MLFKAHSLQKDLQNLEPPTVYRALRCAKTLSRGPFYATRTQFGHVHKRMSYQRDMNNHTTSHMCYISVWQESISLMPSVFGGSVHWSCRGPQWSCQDCDRVV